MLSIKGRYEDGKLVLYANPEEVPQQAQVVVTFMPNNGSAGPAQAEKVEELYAEDQHDEAYYASIREHKRKKASGTITIVDDFEQTTYPLNDYSQGGLSFLAPADFAKSGTVHAGICDPSDPDMVLMELEMEIRGIYEAPNGKKVGCQFQDSLDEDLWHGLVAYLG